MRSFPVAMLLVISVSAFAGADELDELFPGPQEVAGWAISSRIEHYTAAMIDREAKDAVIFHDYNIEEAAVGEYGGPDDARILVRVCRMGSVEDACGIWGALRGETVDKKLEVVQQGYIKANAGGIWKDVYYVSVVGLDEKADLAATVEEFLTVVGSKIPREGTLDDLFRVLDVVGMFKESKRFARTHAALKKIHFVADENVLLLNQDTRVIKGISVVDNRLFECFVAVYPSVEQSAEAASSYAKFMGKHPDAEAAWFKQRGKTIVGVWTGLKVSETRHIEYMMYDMMAELLKQVKIYQLDK